jgi:hypothetical protein
MTLNWEEEVVVACLSTPDIVTKLCIRSEVLTAMEVSMWVLWVVMLCGLPEGAGSVYL